MTRGFATSLISAITLFLVIVSGCVSVQPAGPSSSPAISPAGTYHPTESSGPDNPAFSGGEPGGNRNNLTNVFLAGQKQDLASIPRNTSDIIEANYVPIETARLHARVVLNRMMYDDKAFGPNVIDFTGTVLDEDPFVVYDDSGRYRSYYKFTANTPDGQGAFIDIAASKVSGHSSLRGGIGSYRSEFALFQRAQQFIDTNYSGSTFRSVKLVNNCWGEVVRADIFDPKTRNETSLTMDYWGILGERNCGKGSGTRTPKEISDTIETWEESDAYYRTVSSIALSEGINLSAPYLRENTEKMKEIFSRAGGY